jgi:hypothetical protein
MSWLEVNIGNVKPDFMDRTWCISPTLKDLIYHDYMEQNDEWIELQEGCWTVRFKICSKWRTKRWMNQIPTCYLFYTWFIGFGQGALHGLRDGLRNIQEAFGNIVVFLYIYIYIYCIILKKVLKNKKNIILIY